MKNWAHNFRRALTVMILLSGEFFLFQGFLAFESRADDDWKIELTELMYDLPGSDEKGEWVEGIFDSEINWTELVKKTNGYVLPIRFCSRLTIDKKSCQSGYSFPIYWTATEVSFSKNEIFIIAQDRNEFEKKYPDYKGKIFKSNFSLKNDGENSVGLYQEDANGKFEKLFELNYSNILGGGGNGKTLEKNKEGKLEESSIFGGTPGKKYEKVEVNYSDKIKINEIMPDPIGSDQDGEWFELYNADDKAVELNGWSVKDQSGKKYIFSNEILDSGQWLVFEYEKSKITLNNDGDLLALFNPNGKQVDRVEYKNDGQEGWSWALDEKGVFSWSSIPTPKKKNEFPAKNDCQGIYFSEVLANAKGVDSGNEWIEFFNDNNSKQEISGCYISNNSNKIIQLKNIEMAPKDFFVLKIKNSSFSIKNNNENLKLFSSTGNLVNQVLLVGVAKENQSFSRVAIATDEWSWTNFLTPNKQNIFNQAPSFKIDLEQNIYRNVRAYFNIEKTNDHEKDNLKYFWDFGDGHKSYLKKTSHLYNKKGQYELTVRVSDGVNDVEKQFKIEVKKFPRKKVEIVSFVPNPKGIDSEKEIVTIKNNSGKKINLKNFILATGANSKKLINHKITIDFEIKSGEQRDLTRKEASFSLLNKSGLVVLKYPDGKIADQISYSKDQIADDEKYSKSNGIWAWEGIVEDNGSDTKTNQEFTESYLEVDSKPSNNDIILVRGDFSERFSYQEVLEIVVYDKKRSICKNLAWVMADNWKRRNSFFASFEKTKSTMMFDFD